MKRPERDRCKRCGFGKLNIYVRSVGQMTKEQVSTYTPKQIYDFGEVDLEKFVQQFRKLCPKSSMQLEIITGRPPRILPYLEADFWKAFPKMPGWEFARFVSLAPAVVD